MKKITGKSDVQDLLDQCISTYQTEGIDSYVKEVYTSKLSCKITFPLLEFAATKLYQNIKSIHQIAFIEKIHTLKTIGGNVLSGIILQKRLKSHFKQTIDKTTEFIAAADAWYVCDIIGERVWGFSLL